KYSPRKLTSRVSPDFSLMPFSAEKRTFSGSIIENRRAARRSTPFSMGPPRLGTEPKLPSGDGRCNGFRGVLGLPSAKNRLARHESSRGCMFDLRKQCRHDGSMAGSCPYLYSRKNATAPL